jgi:hypothetical protein
MGRVCCHFGYSGFSQFLINTVSFENSFIGSLRIAAVQQFFAWRCPWHKQISLNVTCNVVEEIKDQVFGGYSIIRKQFDQKRNSPI